MKLVPIEWRTSVCVTGWLVWTTNKHQFQTHQFRSAGAAGVVFDSDDEPDANIGAFDPFAPMTQSSSGSIILRQQASGLHAVGPGMLQRK